MRTQLIQARERMGLSKQEVAKYLGVSPRMYRFYENGERNPTIARANKLEDLFGLPQRVLLRKDQIAV